MNDTMRQSFETRDAWHTWLVENHATAKETLLVFHKKHTGKPGLTYLDALEEALCFGWIDGILRRIDDEKHMIRFCPRRKNSIWSENNKKRVRKLIKEGRMTEAGLVKVQEAKANGQWYKAAVREDVTIIPAALVEALARNEPARRNFENLAPCYRKQFLYWVGSAKRDATRERRIAEVVNLLTRNKRLGMK